jgi:hypothetical protein
MNKEIEDQSVEEEWEAAEAALTAAQKMPGGPDRIEALKRAGQRRYEADRRRHSIQEERKLVRGYLEKLK